MSQLQRSPYRPLRPAVAAPAKASRAATRHSSHSRRASTFVYDGRAAEGGEPLPHELHFTVTGLTKMINGVRTRVLWDGHDDAGQLTEGELTFHAEDDSGNVWNFGEYPRRVASGL